MTRNGSIPLVGAWRLAEFTVERSDFGEIHPFGDASQESLICTDSGRFSLFLMRVDRPRFASGAYLVGTVAMSSMKRPASSYFT